MSVMDGPPGSHCPTGPQAATSLVDVNTRAAAILITASTVCLQARRGDERAAASPACGPCCPQPTTGQPECSGRSHRLRGLLRARAHGDRRCSPVPLSPETWWWLSTTGPRHAPVDPGTVTYPGSGVSGRSCYRTAHRGAGIREG